MRPCPTVCVVYHLCRPRLIFSASIRADVSGDMAIGLLTVTMAFSTLLYAGKCH